MRKQIAAAFARLKDDVRAGRVRRRDDMIAVLNEVHRLDAAYPAALRDSAQLRREAERTSGISVAYFALDEALRGAELPPSVRAIIEKNDETLGKWQEAFDAAPKLDGPTLPEAIVADVRAFAAEELPMRWGPKEVAEALAIRLAARWTP